MTESASAAIGVVEQWNFFPFGLFETLDDELRDAISAPDLIRFVRVGVDEQHPQFVPVAAVDEPWCVDARHAVPPRQAAAWLNEAGVAAGDRYSDAGADHGSAAGGGDHGILSCQQVTASVAIFRISRQWQIRVDTAHRDHYHGNEAKASQRNADRIARHQCCIDMPTNGDCCPYCHAFGA